MWNFIVIIMAIGTTDYHQYVDSVYESKEECAAVVKELTIKGHAVDKITIVEDDYTHVIGENDLYVVEMICKEV